MSDTLVSDILYEALDKKELHRSKHNRKAVTEQSPGLPRFAATLGRNADLKQPHRGLWR